MIEIQVEEGDRSHLRFLRLQVTSTGCPNIILLALPVS